MTEHVHSSNTTGKQKGVTPSKSPTSQAAAPFAEYQSFGSQPINSNNILQLQRAIGNHAVARLLADRGGNQTIQRTPEPASPVVDAKGSVVAGDVEATIQRSKSIDSLHTQSIQRTPEAHVGRGIGPIVTSTPKPRIQREKEKIKFQGQSKKIEQGDKGQFKTALTEMSSKNIKSVAPGQKAKAVLLMGASGSGKASILKEVVPDIASFVHVDPDQVKEAMPQYQAGLAAGDATIANKVHTQSKDVANHMALHAIGSRRNLLFDATGGDLAGYMALITELRRQDFEITLAMTHISVDEGLKRVAERATQTGRKIPDNVVRDMYHWVPLNFVQLVKQVDHAYLFDNMAHKGEHPRLVWETTDGTKLKQNQIDFLQEIVTKIGATKMEDVTPTANDDSDDRDHLPLEAHRRYLQDGGTSRWMQDAGSWKAGRQTSRSEINHIDASLKLYRQYKSKSRGNAEAQAHLLFQLETDAQNSRYQTDTQKNTKTFNRRKQATTMLLEELKREVQINPIRLKKVASEAEQIKELTQVGFTREYLSKILKLDLRLLYEAHAGMAHKQMALAQAALDRLNPVQREKDTGKLKYFGKYIARTRDQMHFAQQVLSSHHHTKIGGLYSRAFAKVGAITDEKMQKLTTKYIRNKDFLSEDTLNTVKNKGMGAKKLAKLVPDFPNLTPQEIEALRIYSSQKYQEMNATMHDIRIDDPTEQKGFKGWSSVSEVAASALSKLPSHPGPMVFRGDNNFGGLVNAAKVGTTFNTPSFMSTSKAVEIAGVFGGDVGWAVKVAPNSRGKDVQPISVSSIEAEVLFPPGTKMQVVDVYRRHGDPKPVQGEDKKQRIMRQWKSESGAPVTPDLFKFIWNFTGQRTVLIVLQEMS